MGLALHRLGWPWAGLLATGWQYVDWSWAELAMGWSWAWLDMDLPWDCCGFGLGWPWADMGLAGHVLLWPLAVLAMGWAVHGMG
jgi:hypothetical protein